MDRADQPGQSAQSPQRAAIVGAGANGLTAAAVLARAGWSVDIYERAPRPGGAATSATGLLGEGTIVDLGAAGHPFGAASPIFGELQLERYGLQWAHPDVPMAHPLESRPAAILHRDLAATAEGLGVDGRAWTLLHRDLVAHLPAHIDNVLAPTLRWPAHPLVMAGFGVRALPPADVLARTLFRDEPARALFTGSAIHAIRPPSRPLTAAFGLLFGALGMRSGWPVVRGGTQGIVDALVALLAEYDVRIHTGLEVTDVRGFVGRVDALLLNLTPAQVLRLEGLDLPPRVRRRLGRWQYGAAVHKIDYLLDGPVPWQDQRVAGAGTVHVGGSSADIRQAEADVGQGRLPTRPFVMVCQQQAADPTRGGTSGGTVLWTYAHVPHGYREERPGQVRGRIEHQIERFAPGFRDRIGAARETSPAQLEAWNPNLVGGDVAGGAMSGLQTLARPGLTLQPYRLGCAGSTSIYLASSSTPPGAGVHGMPGAWAARAVLAGTSR